MPRNEKIRRYIWASLLLILPLFSYPLAWTLPFGTMLPAWDMLQGCTPAVIALAALAAAAAEPRRIIKAWQTSKLLRTFLIAGSLCGAAAALQQIIYGGVWENFFHALFFVTLPWAGIALAPELKRLLPWWCSGLFFFLLWTTVKTPMCTGFPGNWNWNFSLLAITLVSVVLLVFRSRWRLAAAAIAVSAGIFSVFFLFPELAPRGTLAGIIGAAVALGIVVLFKRQERWQYAMIAALAGSILFISAVRSQESATLANARVQLWRGSLEFAIENTITGVGPARFESRIPSALPKEYFLSDFPAVRHPHPHNELLNMWAGFGVAGVLYILMWAVAACRQIRRHDPVGLWILWAFLLMFVHGLFDVLLATPLAGTLFFLMLGTICGSGLSGSSCPFPFHRRYSVAVLLLCLAGFFLCQNLRSSYALWQGRVLLSEKRKAEALEAFARSARIYPTAPALYFAGQTAFFDFKRPQEAIFWWKKISNELRMPSFLHLNRLLGHAYDVEGKSALALHHFDKEAKDFPFSALNAGLRLGALQKNNAPPQQTAEAALLFKRLMEIRKLKQEEFPKLLRNPALDDEPLVK
ncbi:MAG: O-antigen ligase family protein [Lentisphaeria bacterium]|nr:O-antigen ligase family protein [Lentisphaeria bacterium]